MVEMLAVRMFLLHRAGCRRNVPSEWAFCAIFFSGGLVFVDVECVQCCVKRVVWHKIHGEIVVRPHCTNPSYGSSMVAKKMPFYCVTVY